MNRKSKKRLSILKKAVSSDEASPTFTKLNRRISFSGKKSVKEFTCDDDKMTIWGSSYEESADIAHSASQHGPADSVISQSMTSITQGSKSHSDVSAKENEHFNLRNRAVLKRKSNVLKSIPVKPVNNQNDISPNIETVEMDISINENDNKSGKLVSVGEFFSPKKHNNSQIKTNIATNLTPVPPQKISKLNQSLEDTSPHIVGRGSNELPSDSCMMATTYEGSTFLVPSRILEQNDINLTYGFNLSEFDLLHSKPIRPSENVTSFATKIDRINFSNEDEPKNNDNSVTLEIQNPQIEKMRLTGTIVTATDQNLDISIEITDSGKMLDSVRNSPAKSEASPTHNSVLEMFKIRNQLKKKMAKQFEENLEKEYLTPFVPAKFETPNMRYLDSMILDNNNKFDLKQTKVNDELELIKAKETINHRQTIIFPKDSSSLDISLQDDCNLKNLNAEKTTFQFQNEDLETSIVQQPMQTVETKSTRKTIHFPNQELEMSTLPISRELVHQSDRETIYFQNNDLDVTTEEINKIENLTGRTNHFPNQEIDTSTVGELVGTDLKSKRNTIHFSDGKLEMSSIEVSPDLKSQLVNPKFDVIEAVDLEMSIVEPVHKDVVITEVSGRKGNTKRETIHFQNQELESSMFVPPNDRMELDMSKTESSRIVKIEHNNLNLNVPEENSKKCERDRKRDTIHLPNDEIEMSTIESIPKGQSKTSNLSEMVNINKTKNKRGTLHFKNEEVEVSMIVESVDNNLNEIAHKSRKPNNRGTIHFQNQQLELSMEEPTAKQTVNRNLDEIVAPKNRKEYETQTNRDALDFKNRQVVLAEGDSSSSVKAAKEQSERRTIIFPNQELESSTIHLSEEGVNRNDKHLKRDTIYFPEQELEMSMVEVTPHLHGDIEKTKKSTKTCKGVERSNNKRGTIHFPNQELEISTRESALEILSDYGNVDLTEIAKVSEEDKNLIEENIDLQHQEHASEDVASVINLITKAHSTSGINHFPMQQSRTSIVEPFPSIIDKIKQNLNSTVEAKINDNRHREINRNAIHFENQQLEMLRGIRIMKEGNKNWNLTESKKVSPNYKLQSKREIIHLVNNELEMSTMESTTMNDENKNPNLKEVELGEKKPKFLTKRGTIHFTNQQLETSSVESVQNEVKSKRGTLHFPDQQLEMSMEEPHSNMVLQNQNSKPTLTDVAMKGRQTKRGTIHFPNQQLDTSIVENVHNEVQTKRSTLHFPDQQLEMSIEEPHSNMMPQNQNSKQTLSNAGLNDRRQTKRGTIHFQNQQLDTSIVENVHNEVQTKRSTLHFPDQQLEMSIEEPHSNMVLQNQNSKRTLANAVWKDGRQTKRGTIHFPNQQLDTSSVENGHNEVQNQQLEMCDAEPHSNMVLQNKNSKSILDKSVLKDARQTKRGTIHFPNQQLDTSIVGNVQNEVQTKRSTLHFPDQELEMSMEEPPSNLMLRNKSSKPILADAGLKDARQTKRGTIHFPNQQLDTSIVENVHNEVQTKRSTLHFPDQQLEMSIEEPHSNMMPQNQNSKQTLSNAGLNDRRQTKRGTIHFQNQQLDTSIVENVHNEVQTKRSTLHFQNQQLEMSVAEPHSNMVLQNQNSKPILEKSVLKDGRQTKRGTILFPNQQLDTSTVENVQNEVQTKRSTLHFPDQQLEMYVGEPHSNMVVQNQNSKSTLANATLKERQKRGTIHFQNQQLDTSSVGNVQNEVQTKRSTLHFPDQQLEMSTEEPHSNLVLQNKSSKPILADAGLKDARQTKRGTIHFPNQQLDTSIVENLQNEVQTKRSTLPFPNHQLEMSVEEPHSNMVLQNQNSKPTLANTALKDGRQTKRGTIHFPNQQLDTSTVENVHNEVQTKRSTLHFPDQQLEMSPISVNLNEATAVTENQKQEPIRNSIHFQNQPLEMSIMESEPSVNNHRSLNKNRIPQIKRETIYFPNQELETSMEEPVNPKLFTNQTQSTETRKSQLGASTKTICYQDRGDESLDISKEKENIHPKTNNIPDLDISVEDNFGNVDSKSLKRGTIYFNNNNMVDTSILESNQNTKHLTKFNLSNRRTIHYGNDNDLDVSIQELNQATKYSKREPAHMETNATNCRSIDWPHKLVPGTTYYADKTLDKSEFETTNHNMFYHDDNDLDTSEIEPKIKSLKQPLRSTICFQNEVLDTSTNGDLEQMDTSTNSINSPTRAEHRPRGTIYYKSDDLETTQIVENNQNQTNAIPKLIHRITKLHGTGMNDNYQTEDLKTTTTNTEKNHESNNFNRTTQNKLEISDQVDLSNTHSIEQYLKFGTKRGISRIKELENKIWGQRKPANKSFSVPDRTSTNHSKINLDNNDKTNLEDFNMTNDFDEKHINQQSTMTMTHLVKFLSEKRNSKEQLEKSDTINIDNEEMNLSSFEKQEEQLANDLSGLKVFGNDSTYFANNTQALCNLDPKRIFCVSKFDAMNAAATNSNHEDLTVSPKRSLLPVPIKKSDDTLRRGSNISTHQLMHQDENTLNDFVPRKGVDDSYIFQDFLEITANLVQQNKTRQDMCNDYINLTLSRFSTSIANSSNVGLDQIDQTSINLVNSFDDIEEEEEQPKVSIDNLKYVPIEEVDQAYQNVDKMFTRKRTTHVPVLDFTKCQELLNQPTFSDIANAYKLKNLQNLKRVSESFEPTAGPEKPSLRFLMNNYREQLTVEKPVREMGIIPFLPLTPKISVLLQNKLAERQNYWTCHDTYYNHGVLVFTHHRIPCVELKMVFELFEETEYGELEFTSVFSMMSKTKIIASTFELIQHLEFFKKVPAEMKNSCRSSNEILDFLANLDNKIIIKNYEDVQNLKEILIRTNSKIWHDNETGNRGITKTLIHNRTINDIVININDLQITDISDVTVKPHVLPTKKVTSLSRGLDFLRELLEKPKDYFNF